VPDNLIRLSVGAEHPQDVIDDLEVALAGANDRPEVVLKRQLRTNGL
jgi:hypothetical protein